MCSNATRWACAALGLVCVCLLAVAPARACGCGVYLPREGDAHVTQERALIRWDGHTEDIVMELGVAGSSREAAWILPVPSQATAKLADARLFDTLQELTKPVIEVQPAPAGPLAGGGGPPPVELLTRQTLGPFDVSTLAAHDATALTTWLATHGYQFPARLREALRPYVDQQWFYVAVRLAPGSQGQPLTGRLDPLWVTFTSDRIVYPMRATALAANALSLFLYVLADHRVAPPSPFNYNTDPQEDVGYAGIPDVAVLSVQFAGWIAPESLAAPSPLRPFMAHRWFLTKVAVQISAPQGIRDDFVFSFAPRDAPYRDVEIHYMARSSRAMWVMIGTALLLALGLFLWRFRHRLGA